MTISKRDKLGISLIILKMLIFGEMVVHDKKWSFTLRNGRSRLFHANSRFFHGRVLVQHKLETHGGRSTNPN